MRSISERTGKMGEVLRRNNENISNEIRVALPGVIESFDTATQTAVVRAALRERMLIDGKEEDTEIPLIPDVPVYFPGGSNFDISYPVLPGMECLLVFADCCMDAWWESGGVQNQTEIRRHDLSDGFALVGFRSQQGLAEKYRDDALVLRAEDTLLEISPEEVKVTTTGVLVNAQSKIEMNTENTTVNASRIDLNGVLVINGEQYVDHRHKGVTTGSGNTGGKV